MADKKITDLQLRDDCDDGVNFPGDDTLQTYRLTAAQIKAYVLANFKPPTMQIFTSGSGTYTLPDGCTYIKVKMVGGGSGGAGSGVSGAGAGSSGGDTTFGTTLLVAGGASTTPANLSYGGPGGTASLGTGPIGTAIQGGWGGSASGSSVGIMYPAGGSGAGSPFGGNGTGGSGPTTAAVAAVANSGSGGGGGGAPNTSNCITGAGGGAGGFIDAIIQSPSGSYAYSVGAKGTGGGAGSSGFAGADGGSGVIIVEEYYQ